MGEDPYPTAGTRDGLAFSAGKGRPRSLARIFELPPAHPGAAGFEATRSRSQLKAGRGRACCC